MFDSVSSSKRSVLIYWSVGRTSPYLSILRKLAHVQAQTHTHTHTHMSINIQMAFNYPPPVHGDMHTALFTGRQHFPLRSSRNEQLKSNKKYSSLQMSTENVTGRGLRISKLSFVHVSSLFVSAVTSNKY